MSLSALCQTCGFCCDGSLFTFASVDRDHALALRARDVALDLRPDGTYRLPQRCSALNGTCCTVYEDRPASCRSYVCHLGAAFEEGEVSLDQAQELVSEARTRIAELERVWPAPAGAAANPVRRLRHAQASDDPTLSAEARAAGQQVNDFLQRTFTGRHGQR